MQFFSQWAAHKANMCCPVCVVWESAGTPNSGQAWANMAPRGCAQSGRTLCGTTEAHSSVEQSPLIIKRHTKKPRCPTIPKGFLYPNKCSTSLPPLCRPHPTHPFQIPARKSEKMGQTKGYPQLSFPLPCGKGPILKALFVQRLSLTLLMLSSLGLPLLKHRGL